MNTKDLNIHTGKTCNTEGGENTEYPPDDALFESDGFLVFKPARAAEIPVSMVPPVRHNELQFQ